MKLSSLCTDVAFMEFQSNTLSLPSLRHLQVEQHPHNTSALLSFRDLCNEPPYNKFEVRPTSPYSLIARLELRNWGSSFTACHGAVRLGAQDNTFAQGVQRLNYDGD